MNLRLSPFVPNGTVAMHPSKSHLHRLLLLSGLANAPTNITGAALLSDDILATANCLRQLGVLVEETKDGLLVTPTKALPTQRVLLNVGESGSTYRFLLPVLGALGLTATLSGTGRLADRPMQSLLDVLTANGMQMEGETLPLSIRGQLKPGVYQVAGNVSSQYISGLLFALSLLEGDSQIVLTSPLESAPYVALTLNTLAAFHAKVEPTADGYLVKGIPKFVSPTTIAAEGDWSNGASWLALAACTGGTLTVTNLTANSQQGDQAVCDILSQASAYVVQTENRVLVRPAPLRAFTMDAKHTPDLVPVLSAVAAKAKGVSTFTNVQRLLDKESNRIAAILDVLTSFGIRAWYDGNLNIEGGEPKPATVSCHGDHRIVMLATILASLVGGTLLGAEAVQKSYPRFFSDYQTIGGKVDEMEW